MMKQIIKREIFLFFLLLTVVSIKTFAFAEVRTSLWQDKKSQHFIIYYQTATLDYVDNLINNAEKYYNDIVEELGFSRFDFWTWDNRAKIYLYGSSEEYLNDTGRMAWSGAMVNIKKRTIKTFINQENFMQSILPHEMAHIIFREFIGLSIKLPLWLDEGVACSQEKVYLSERLLFAKHLVKSNMHIPIKRLSEISDYSLVVPKVFYSEAASLIVFLLEGFGKEQFLDFSRRLRDDNKGWRETLLDTYRFSDIEDFEAQWHAYIKKE